MDITIPDLNIDTSPESRIKSLYDSIKYIEDRLLTFYNTEKEKEDILRNISHIELLLSDNEIFSKLNEEEIEKINNTIFVAKSKLGL